MNAGWRLAVTACLLIAGAVSAAAAPQRIVSINACTDQLLFEIAGPGQIAALTRYAIDPSFSRYSTEVKAAGVRLISGSAEEVLKLKPDLVLTGAWSRSATRAHLKASGITVETLAPEPDVAGVLAAVTTVARLTGHEDRGAALTRGIEQALATAPHFEGRLSALQIQRRGYVSGRRTLAGDILERLGAVNAAGKLGISGVGAASLEAVLKARPDVLIVTGAQPGAPDQGAALLHHPALEAAYPPERRIELPARMSECGAAEVAEVIRVLGDGLRRVPR